MKDFEKIYTGYVKDVYKFLIKLSGNPDIAEELTQATFAKAFEHMEQFQGRCKISVWLCQIAKNEYFMYCRKNRHFSFEEVPKSYTQPGSMEEDVIDKDEKLRILKVLSMLPEPYQEVFTLRVMGDVSYRDISLLFGKSESWARVTYYRAKGMIIERLGGADYDAM